MVCCDVLELVRPKEYPGQEEAQISEAQSPTERWAPGRSRPPSNSYSGEVSVNVNLEEVTEGQPKGVFGRWQVRSWRWIHCSSQRALTYSLNQHS